jgi:hypothetical protein
VSVVINQFNESYLRDIASLIPCVFKGNICELNLGIVDMQVRLSLKTD